MLSLSRTRVSIAVLFALTALLVSSLIAPANAAKPTDRGKASTKTSSTVTEDNDRYDGGTPNNVVDDGDNAHPSGKDRSVEHGKSGNQGKATSNPDNDGKGPERHVGNVDKPDHRGGVDLADQDGNNGCGNDDDFEDDNEGWCGGKPRPSTNQPTKPAKPAKPAQPAKPAKPTTGNNGHGNSGHDNSGHGNSGNGNSGHGNSGHGNSGHGNANPGNNPGRPSKIGICHRTGSTTNPYVWIHVSERAIHGHSAHAGDVIGASSAAACPGATTTLPGEDIDNPDRDTDGEVGGVIVVHPPVGTNTPDPVVIINTPRRPGSSTVRDLVRADVPEVTEQQGRDLVRADVPEVTEQQGRVLAATGGRVPTLISIAALSLLMGAGLLGTRRFARSSR